MGRFICKTQPNSYHGQTKEIVKATGKTGSRRFQLQETLLSPNTAHSLLPKYPFFFEIQTSKEYRQNPFQSLTLSSLAFSLQTIFRIPFLPLF
jgi:hypothetical protein